MYESLLLGFDDLWNAISYEQNFCKKMAERDLTEDLC